MEKINRQYRQGDILLVAVDALPMDVEAIASSAQLLTLVPAGPGPGSHHLAASSGLRAFSRKGGDGLIEWLELTGNLTLAHPEHAPIMLEPGIWRVVRQREYDPAAGQRRVLD